MVAQKNLCVLILAAGKGTRMKSSLPKPLHRVCGIPMIAHSLRAAQSLNPGAICVVVGHEAQLLMQTITENLQAWGIKAPVVFAEQKELNGSGGAVRAALPLLSKFEAVMVLNGDAPMIRPETLQQMYSIFETEKAGAMVLGVTVPNPTGYGRILREKDGTFDCIVEENDADEKTKKVTEVNGGMYVFNGKDLVSALALLKPQGLKQEFYLTDTLSFIKDFQTPVLVFNTADYQQALGVNSRQELALAEDLMRARIADKLMDNGVRLVRPKEVYIDEEVQVGEDTIICPGCYLKGKTVIGKNCRLDGSVFITDSIIGDNVFIKMGSYIENSVIEDNCEVGPYAHLRPKSTLKKKAKVGNFCEIKNSVIGEGSKVNHLTYIGDTDMGAGVNIGAGTITCNYDGEKKHRTVIGDHSFVGSNVNFVAPVEVKAYSKIGAGSTITKEVPEGSLAIARARQVVLENKGIKKHD
ncbi:MAG: bifunctional UDP-N-acetylglucosamine diphosphorylase/glucosamine-1-phosphate N-acetyltransferase GlmU [Elusimicrobiaceae bacterium]|nr:bifunctional UDP-N-acetylglucosamine diphosphorylase/glucosamine-1-phosphate N-acetyltransferase GlmU [Elusimicrobiaceae bacterium]